MNPLAYREALHSQLVWGFSRQVKGNFFLNLLFYIWKLLKKINIYLIRLSSWQVCWINFVSLLFSAEFLYHYSIVTFNCISLIFFGLHRISIFEFMFIFCFRTNINDCKLECLENVVIYNVPERQLNNDGYH